MRNRRKILICLMYLGVVLNKMNELYNSACFTLSLGTLEEGFGLTTIESLLAHVPVISRRIGATPDLIGGKPGIFYYDEHLVSPIEVVRDVLSMSDDELTTTSIYIRNEYPVEKMTRQYHECIKEVLND